MQSQSSNLYNWRHAWALKGLVGLISGHAGGRPRKLSEACLATVCELARTQVLTLRGSVQQTEAIHGHPFPLSTDRLGAILRKNGFSFKRTRISLKNRNPERFAARAAELAGLNTWAREGGCQLFFTDEVGFSVAPPVHSARSPVGPVTFNPERDSVVREHLRTKITHGWLHESGDNYHDLLRLRQFYGTLDSFHHKTSTDFHHSGQCTHSPWPRR